eukprot:9171977-Alexandrium_andersonii.AAC.1
MLAGAWRIATGSYCSPFLFVTVAVRRTGSESLQQSVPCVHRTRGPSARGARESSSIASLST